MSGMQIVIPMSGFGERFRRAGYTVPKPLIPVDGKPIIAHVIDMFPGETDFLFICNREHLDEPAYEMAEILKTHCPTGRILAIDPHREGPVGAVRKARDLIDPDRPMYVNYCDFTCYWQWDDFKRFVAETQCEGAVPAYRDFHPHSLHENNYAFIREEGGWLTDIQEKQPWTDNRMSEYASSGGYYFASGALGLDLFDRQRRNIQRGKLAFQRVQLLIDRDCGFQLLDGMGAKVRLGLLRSLIGLRCGRWIGSGAQQEGTAFLSLGEDLALLVRGVSVERLEPFRAQRLDRQFRQRLTQSVLQHLHVHEGLVGRGDFRPQRVDRERGRRRCRFFRSGLPA